MAEVAVQAVAGVPRPTLTDPEGREWVITRGRVGDGGSIDLVAILYDDAGTPVKGHEVYGPNVPAWLSMAASEEKIWLKMDEFSAAVEAARQAMNV